jgi:hypothetical protein
VTSALQGQPAGHIRVLPPLLRFNVSGHVCYTVIPNHCQHINWLKHPTDCDGKVPNFVGRTAKIRLSLVLNRVTCFKECQKIGHFIVDIELQEVGAHLTVVDFIKPFQP